MYFFSATDPNYRIKGSRDPLGVQTLWAAAGHNAVAHLSTVSVSLRDFMILTYAHHFYGDPTANCNHEALRMSPLCIPCWDAVKPLM